MIKGSTKSYNNFPKPGVNFIDIFPIVSEPKVFSAVIDCFQKQLENVQYDKMFML